MDMFTGKSGITNVLETSLTMVFPLWVKKVKVNVFSLQLLLTIHKQRYNRIQVSPCDVFYYITP
jgi:uncharacterized protein YebE (UPF0316 family)